MKPGPSRHEDSGAVIVEFAIIFVLFMALLWGIIGYGVVFAVQQNLTHAASEATRSSLALDGPEAEQNARDVLATQLEWLGNDRRTAVVDAATINSHTCTYNATLQCLTVAVSYNWAADPIVPELFSVAIPDVLTATATIQLTPAPAPAPTPTPSPSPSP